MSVASEQRESKFRAGAGLHRPGNTPAEDASMYASSLLSLPRLLKERAFKVFSKEELLASSEGTQGLKKVLKGIDVIMVGIGIILGSGIYVTTGAVANEDSGPAVILSYIVAGISAMVTGLAYAEYSVDFPVAGGSYTYILATFGEIMAWFTVGMMVIQYMLANAGVARAFSGYFANLVGQSTDFFIIAGYIDFWAFALVAAFTAMLVFGTKESALFNNACNLIAVACVIFVIITGFIHADLKNLQPFFGEFGWRGVFNGAAIVFFSYIGFDAICNTAEEVINPQRDLPIGLVGSLSTVTVLYVLAAMAIVAMVPYTQIDPSAAFSAAFVTVGAGWASYVVAAGACVAIVTGVLVGVMTVPRLVAAAAREALIPPFFGAVHPKYGTPYVATIATGGLTACIALFTSLGALLDLTSICVLTVYAIIGAGALWRRYFVAGEMTALETTKLSIHFGLIIIFSILTGCGFVYSESVLYMGIAFLCWLVVTISMAFFCKPKYIPERFKMPLQPFLGSFSVLANLFLLCTVPLYAFAVYGVFLLILLAIYMLYGIHGAALREERAGITKLEAGDEDEEEEEGLAKGDEHMGASVQMTRL